MTISEIMAKHSLTDRDISVLFNIPERTVRSWRYGERVPPDYLIEMIRYICELHFEEGLSYGKEKGQKAD